MQIIEKSAMSTDAAVEYVAQCERTFEAELQHVSDIITEDTALRVMTLAGPTCSGKTTTAAKLTDDIEKCGKRARVLSVDDFYKNDLAPDANGNYDFETVNAIDLDCLAECVDGLFGGRSVMLPTFDFTKQCRAGESEYTPHENDIYIFEGIQAVYPEVRALLAGYNSKDVFISVSDDVEVNGVFFTRHEIRLMRRLIRDYAYRGSSPEFTFKLWSSVRANEEANIYPNLTGGEITINSFLPYEIFLIGDEVRPLLETVTDGECGAEKAKSLLEKLDAICDIKIPKSLVPLGSVYREFIS